MPDETPLPNGGTMAEDATPAQQRLEPVLCPHCEQVTMPNLLADRSAVCSCPAERSLPAALLEAEAATVAPMDAAGLDGTRREEVGPPRLPPDNGQFGRNVATEAYEPLEPPPARPK